ncbi:hypothetical protein [Methylobacterium sp. WL6]|uniref:hypothetical protein n=1 Tax=Methylobacterium sp. WL6 TaxID=2603901 RepID=UPI0011C9D2C9|nr:hypothetical protein [Methylobacterium sp. WL6]TXN73437.1 hypothetical protein FV230_01315 [Methylobacterium sp. WL6]
MHRHTERDRLSRLKAELLRNTDPAAHALAAELAACGVDWGGRYRCRCPACWRCRRTYIQQQQRAAVAWVDGLNNADLAFASIVASGDTDINRLGETIAGLPRHNRNRIDAERRADPERWSNVALRAWIEVDAVGGDQIPLLGSSRRSLLPQIAPIALDQPEPTWLATYHGIVYVGGLNATEIGDAFRRQWPLAGQVDVRPLDQSRTVEHNVADIVSYANKHTCTTTVGTIREPWPISWQAAYYSMIAHRRNAFEFLRFGIGSSYDSTYIVDEVCTNGYEDDAMPFVYSSIILPM